MKNQFFLACETYCSYRIWDFLFQKLIYIPIFSWRFKSVLVKWSDLDNIFSSLLLCTIVTMRFYSSVISYWRKPIPPVHPARKESVVTVQSKKKLQQTPVIKFRDKHHHFIKEIARYHTIFSFLFLISRIPFLSFRFCWLLEGRLCSSSEP